MDFASRWCTPARKRRNRAGSVQVRHAALLGHSWQRRKSFQRHDSFYSAGMARKASAEDRRLRRRGCLWTRFQRGISAIAMGLSVYLFLCLLAAVGILRLLE